MKRIALVLSALFIMSCGDDGVRPNADSFVISAEISKPSFRIGDSTAVRITMKNNSTTSATASSGACVGFFQVFRNGVNVYPANVICDASLRSISIAAGESYVVTAYWRGDTYNASGNRVLLPPADYTLQASAGYALKTKDGGIARSATQSLTLLPAQ